MEWSSHELYPGVYDFDGIKDVVSYFQLAQDVGLDVILRYDMRNIIVMLLDVLE